MPVTVEQSNPASNDPPAAIPPATVAEGSAVPGWLEARRRERSNENTDSPASTSASLKAKPPALKPRPSLKSQGIRIVSGDVTEWARRRVDTWFSKQGMIGAVVSLALHAIVLLILAFILVSQVSTTELSTIMGMQGNSDEFTAEVVLDSELPSDEGESGPLEITDASQIIDSMGLKGDIAESMHLGFGGKGNGEGNSGDGNGLGVGALKIPGHAQTKGSFSAWSDPKDPGPDEDYDIVIQIKLPPNVTKFRASDITGNVIGTDSYRQAIRFRTDEVIPIEQGMARIRIRVPGGHRLVRDTIRIESKLLREKQVFEIVF